MITLLTSMILAVALLIFVPAHESGESELRDLARLSGVPHRSGWGPFR